MLGRGLFMSAVQFQSQPGACLFWLGFVCLVLLKLIRFNLMLNNNK